MRTALACAIAAWLALGAALLAVAKAPPAAACLALAASALLAALHARRTTHALRERAARVAHEVRGPLSAAHLALHGAARRREIGPVLVAALELELRRAALALEEPSAARPTDLDLHALLSCQLRTWQDVASAHGAALTLEPGPGTAVVHADALRLAQATSNVLANAIEHGGGPIAIRTVRVADRIRVEVSDGGPGLPASVAELARRPRGRRGRGLAITRSVLSHCGGHLAPLAPGSGIAIDLPLSGSQA